MSAETLRQAVERLCDEAEALTQFQDDEAWVLAANLHAVLLATTPAPTAPRPSTGPGWSCPACDGRMRVDQLPHALALIHEGHPAPAPTDPEQRGTT